MPAVDALAREEHVAHELLLANLQVGLRLGGELAVGERARARVVEPERRSVARGERSGGIRVCEGGEPARGCGGGERVRDVPRGRGARADAAARGDHRSILRAPVLAHPQQRVERRPPRLQTGLLREPAMELGELDRGGGGALARELALDGVRGGALVGLHRGGQARADEADGVAVEALGGALGVIGPDAPRGEGAAHEATDQRGGVGLAGCGGCRDGAFHGHVGSLARSVGRDGG